MKKTFIHSIFLFLVCISIPFQQLEAAERTISLEDAILKTLESNLGVKIQKEKVRQSEGALQKASGTFDWTGTGTISRELQKLPLTELQKRAAEAAAASSGGSVTDKLKGEDTALSIGVSKKSRTGITVSPTVSALDSYDNSSQYKSVNRSDVNVEIVIPLLRGLGVKNTGANELAARSNLNTSELLSKHNISKSVFSTASAYWKCLAAGKNVEILEDSEKRSFEIFKLVELLVQGGEIEPFLLNQARAKLLIRQSSLSDARLELYKSKQALAVAIGLTPQELSTAPRVEGTYPEVINPDVFETLARDKYINEALRHRADYLSSKVDINTEEILLHKAENDIKPRLDFSFRVGYAGLDESSNAHRYYEGFSNNLTGGNVFGALNLELPIENNAARGEMLRRKALVKEKAFTAAELSNNIASQVLVAMETLRRTIHEYNLSRKSTEDYRKAVIHENAKLKENETTLTSVIDIEDRYSEARVAENNAMSKYIVALAELRYVTGTVFEEDGKDEKVRFRLKSLMELPF